MEIETRDYKRVTVLRVTGRVDANTAPAFEAQLKALTDAGRSVALELDGTAYLSSAGVRALISAQKALKARGAKLVIAQPSERVHEVLKISGLEPLFEIFDNTEAAVGAL
jgi:anti-anti-sigma factor